MSHTRIIVPHRIQIPSFVWDVVVALLLWVIVGYGMWLRIEHADQYPISQNDDGLFYVWAGNSILDNFFHPTTLSIFEQANDHMVWRSQYKNIYPSEQFGYRIVDPWFDHPFLSTIFIALPARALGFRDFDQIPHMIVRAPALIAALGTLLMTYYLTRTVSQNRWVSLLAAAFISFWPLAAFSQRQSYFENFMTPIFLFLLAWLWKYKQHASRKLLIGIVVACFMLSWTKIVGYASFLLAAFWLWESKLYKPAITVAISGFVSLTLYVGYGLLLSGTGFFSTILNQGGRGAYLASIFHIFNHPEVYGIIQDGWWFLGLLAMGWAISRTSLGARFIAGNFWWWMMVQFVISGPENTSPWYRYPVYPLMMIGLAFLVEYYWNHLSVFVASLFVILGFTGFSLAQIPLNSSIIRMITVALIGIFSLVDLYKTTAVGKWAGRIVLMGMLGLCVYGNILAIRIFPSTTCTGEACLKPTRIEIRQ